MSKWFTAKQALRGNPGLRALNAHALAACPPGELEQLKGELAAREERSEQSAAAAASGQELEDWPGLGPLELTAPYAGAEAGAVIIQSAGPAAILAAARVE